MKMKPKVGGRFSKMGYVKFQPRVTSGKFRAVARNVPKVAVKQFVEALDSDVLPLDFTAAYEFAKGRDYQELMDLIVDPTTQEYQLKRFIDMLWALRQLVEHYGLDEVQP